MKLDSSRPAALSFKILESGQQEIRPPLTPATEVDLQKSCAILVQSTGCSKSFKDAVGSSQRRQNKTVPVVRSHGRTPSKAGTRTPVGRVAKHGASGHKKNGSTVRYDKTSTSRYVPPRRPAPEKAVSTVPKGKGIKKEDASASKEKEDATVKKDMEVEQTYERRSSGNERKSTDGSSGEEGKSSNKKGVKKLVNVVTGYIRPHDTGASPPQPAAEFQSSPTRIERTSTEATSSSTEKASEPSKVKSSRRRDGTTYVEALPEHLHAKISSDDDRKPGELRRSVSKRLKEYVKPPHVDRFTPEPLHHITEASKETSRAVKDEPRKAEHKKHRVTKAMKEYVKPSPLDIPHATSAEEEEPVSAKTEKTFKSAKSLPAEKPTPSLSASKETQKSPIEPASSSKQNASTSPSHHHHNPFRLIHDYVKPSMTEAPAPLQTNLSPTSSHLSPVIPSVGRPLTPQLPQQQPSKPYVPPKIRPRGKTLPSSGEAPLSLDPVPTLPTTRQGPIFGGGYPVKQTQDELLGVKDNKENRSPVSPGFFGRNPAGGGFRIHFSHFLHKQRSDGYDQLE